MSLDLTHTPHGLKCLKRLNDIDMTEEVESAGAKRKVEEDGVNWPGSDLEQALEKKLEDAQSSDDAGGESSEFMTADEAAGVAVLGVPEVEPRDVDESASNSESEHDRNAAIDNAQVASMVRAPIHNSEFEIGRMMREADEKVARIMRLNFPPQSSSREVEMGSESGSEGSADDGDDMAGVAEENEETQLVQDSLAVDAITDLPTPLDDRDSGHGSMDSDDMLDAEEEQSSVAIPGAAAEQSLLGGSQDRMSAVEETVRQIKAERNGDTATDSQAPEESSSDQEAEIGGVHVDSEIDADDARNQYVADRKARKKERNALYRQQREDAVEQQPNVRPAAVSTTANLSAQVPGSSQPLVERITLITPPSTSVQPTKTKSNRRSRTSKQRAKKRAVRRTALASISNTFTPKQHTRTERRRIKRERRAAESKRLAREDTEAYVAMLEAKIVDVPALPRDAGVEQQREWRGMVKQVRKARARLESFREGMGGDGAAGGAEAREEGGGVDVEMVGA